VGHTGQAALVVIQVKVGVFFFFMLYSRSIGVAEDPLSAIDI
jgi:hypothetical protein